MKAVTISDWEVVLRLALSLVLCAIVGAEREARGQVAGLRTHVIVGVGSTLFTLISAYAFEDFTRASAAASGAPARVDPTRIAAQVVAGIGFLGAGAIIRQGANVRGLTTAAALWIAAAIGMAVGAGYYFGAVVATALVLVALVGLRYLRPAVSERFGPPSQEASIELQVDRGAGVGAAIERLLAEGVELQGIASLGSDRYSVALRTPQGVEVEELIADLIELAHVRSARVAPAAAR
ncbi:MAG: MgtC/SapB family protein [Thermoleophilaceae bacterium]|nr:MgtC/SapB family protein [Thermoleophilaceae bacterium]